MESCFDVVSELGCVEHVAEPLLLSRCPKEDYPTRSFGGLCFQFSGAASIAELIELSESRPASGTALGLRDFGAGYRFSDG